MHRDRATLFRGWGFVAVQAILLALLIVLPGRNDWPTPRWVELAGAALIAAGLLVIAAASLNLGRSLTPTPVPKERGTLRTDGLYRFVRHPIYSGVLAIVIGLVARSGSLLTLVLGGATILFFDRKAAWEEARLSERFPEPHGYLAYCARTPRWVPRPMRRKEIRPDP